MLTATKYVGITIIPSAAGRYRLESATDLNGPWTQVTTVDQLITPWAWIDYDSPTTVRKFFRATLLPYLGNPVRHFQHLASRMFGPRAEIRSWRAWLCFHLAEQVLTPAEFPRDGEQIAREGLWIPSYQRALHEVNCSVAL